MTRPVIPRVAVCAALVTAVACGGAAKASAAGSLAGPEGTQAEASLPKLAWVSVHIAGGANPAVGGATVRFSAQRGSEKVVADNGPSDFDSRLGVIKAAIPAAPRYMACLQTPAGFDGAEPNTCRMSARAGASVDLGDLGPR